MAMDLKSLTIEQLYDFLKCRNVPQDVLESLKDNGIDGCYLFRLRDDFTEFKAVVPKANHRLLIKQIMDGITDDEIPSAGQEAQNEDSSQEPLLQLGSFDLDDLLNLCDSNKPSAPFTANPTFVLPNTTNSVSSLPEYIPSQGDTKCTNEHIQAMAGSSCSRQKASFCREEAQVGSKAKETKLPDDLPFPDNFSMTVQAAISANNVLPERRQLIAEVAKFYYAKSEYLAHGDIKRVAVEVCNKFPDLRDSNTPRYWVSVANQLSQYFRNRRKRSKHSKSSKSGARMDPKPSKRARMSSSAGDDQPFRRRNLQLQSITEAGALSDPVKEAYLVRRKFIVEEAKSGKEILEMYPWLQNSSKVRSELQLLLGDSCVTGAEGRLVRGLKVILGHDCETLMNTEVVEAVKIIQQQTKRKSNDQDLFKFHDPRTTQDRMFKDKEFLLTCIGSTQEVHRVFVSGECQAFFESNCDLVKALVDLISAYYVFNVRYPQSISGILHFLQEVALQQSDSKYKLTKYATFMAKFRKGSLK